MSRSSITTAEQLLANPIAGRVELVRGKLRVMSPAGMWHGAVAMHMGSKLFQFAADHDLGQVFAAETGFVLERNPDTVRAPDVAFVSKDRLGPVTERGFFEGHPDLAVEVLSPDDTRPRVREKVACWLTHGTRLVWVVDPRARRVAVHRAGRPVLELRASDTLDGEDVLPGFTLRVDDLWPR